MLTEKKNIINSDFSLSIETEIMKFFQCSDAVELTQTLFDTYISLFGLKSTSLFLMDNKSFEFIHYQSEGNIIPEKIIKIFDRLVADGVIAKALNSDNLIEDELLADEELNSICYTKPLVSNNGIMGLLLLIGEQNAPLTYENKNFINIMSKIFSMLLSNFELRREIMHVKETSELKLEEKTSDIIQGSRELKLILDYLHVGIFITDKSSGEISDVNLMAQKIIGFSKEEIIGKRRSDFFYFLDTTDTSSQISSINEGILQISNGSIIPILHKPTEVTLNKEEFVIDNFVDISDRKAMEIELQKAHDELEQKVLERTKQLTKTNSELKKEIIEKNKAEAERMKLYWAVHQSPSIIVITDINGNIEYVNPSFEKISGYSSEEILGKNPRFLKSGDLSNNDYKNLWNNIKSGKEWKKEFINRKKNGDLYWVSSIISPVKNIDGEVTNFLAVQEDITERKNAELEIIIAKEKAEASDKFKTTLLANMSHEFRTPLISVIGFADFLREEIVDEEQKDLAKAINDAGKRLLNTLNSVLLLSQVESLYEDMIFTIINIPERIEDLLSPHIMAAEIKGLKLNYESFDDPISVKADYTLFSQMMNNIIDNAIKYTNEGAISITSRISIEGFTKYALIEVKDTGIGISENDFESIFEAFKQLSEGYNRSYEGTGLGLTLAKKIAVACGGEIRVKSEVGIGSTFSIIIPISESSAEN